MPIRKEDILSDKLLIQINNPKAKIIGSRIIRVSREVINSRITNLNQKNSVGIDFKILEENDGLVGNVVYEGEVDDEFLVTGEIEGVKEIIMGSTNILIVNTGELTCSFFFKSIAYL